MIAASQGIFDSETVLRLLPQTHQRIDYVCGFAMRGKWVLLIHKLRPAWQNGLLNGVGGKMEPGETPVEAMVREFSEEAGRTTAAGDWRLFCSLTDSRQSWRVCFFVTHAINWATQPTHTHGPETEQIEWVKIKDVVRGKVDTVPNLRWLVPLALEPDVTFASALFGADLTGPDGRQING
jgi:8-oxo-dGTP diphosphatase